MGHPLDTGPSLPIKLILIATPDHPLGGQHILTLNAQTRLAPSQAIPLKKTIGEFRPNPAELHSTNRSEILAVKLHVAGIDRFTEATLLSMTHQKGRQDGETAN
jgi:hypothetical protein